MTRAPFFLVAGLFIATPLRSFACQVCTEEHDHMSGQMVKSCKEVDPCPDQTTGPKPETKTTVAPTAKKEDAPYTVSEAAKIAAAEFQEALDKAKDPRKKAIIAATRDLFMVRLKEHQGGVARDEVQKLDEMLLTQMNYGRQMWELTAGLPKEKRVEIMRTLIEKGPKGLEGMDLPRPLVDRLTAKSNEVGEQMHQYHGSNGPTSIMSTLHNALFDAYGKVTREGKGAGDDYIPTMPGNHGDFMKKHVDNDPAADEIAGREALLRGDKVGGMRALENAIAKGGGADALNLHGALLAEKGDYQGAAADASKALQLRPGDKEALGLLHSVEGRGGVASAGSSGSSGSRSASAGGAGPGSGSSAESSEFAKGGWSSSAKLVPGMTSSSALAARGFLQDARRALGMGDLSAALAAAQKALDLDPSNAAAHALVAAIYAKMKDWHGVVNAASKGLAASSNSSELYAQRAVAHNRLKQWDKALSDSELALQYDSKSALAWAARAHAAGMRGDHEAEVAALQKAASLDPFYQKALEDAKLQLPTADDVLFLFPGEDAPKASGAAPERKKSPWPVVAAGLLGGLLLALGLLSTVLAPLKESVVSAFTRVSRRGPNVGSFAAEEPAAAPAAPPASSGSIRGQYEILRKIGAGGMGEVFEGTDRSLGRRVAIKKMRDELRVNQRERERFLIEAKTVAALHHPNIVDIYAIAEEGEDVYLVFEYVDGRTIHDILSAQGRLNPSDAVRITQAMSDALSFAHGKGVIHRDVKPSNVMLSGASIKVMDFGIARMAKDAMTRYSMTNTVVGTPPYMAPEQEQGVVRKESDVYALAICSYEMLTGKLPFIGIGAGMLMNKINMSYVPPSRAIAGLPTALDAVFAKALQADPEQRYRSPQDFSVALAAAFGGSKFSRKVA